MVKNRLRELREEKGISQIALAELMDVRNTTISNWEQSITEIDFASLIKICDYFKVSIDYFLMRKDY